MDGEQRDSKNTTKNLFVGLAAANEKKASNPSGECDNQPNNNNGKRRRVSFGRRITYFQPPSSTSGSSSSYVRMVSPAPTPSPLPPDLFEDTHAIFDHFQQRAPDATRTLREDSTIELHKSAQSDDDVNAVSLPSEVLTLSLTQNDLQSGQQQKGPADNAFDSSLDSADEDEVIVRMEEDSTDEDEYAVKEAEEEEMNNISVQMEEDLNLTGEVLASIEKEAEENNSNQQIMAQMEEESTRELSVQQNETDHQNNSTNKIAAQMDLTGEVLASIKEAEENNSNQIVSQMEESQPQETTEIIDTSPIPEEVICQIEDDYFEALHEYVEKTKLFYKLQDEKLQLLGQMQERTRTMREENQAFWANLENGIVEVLREVANARRRGPQ